MAGCLWGVRVSRTRADKGGVAWQVNKAETMPDLGLSFIETGGSKANAEEAAEEVEEEE